MKFEKIEIKLEVFASRDVIDLSLEEETTVSPIEPSKSNDPYENDKW